MPLGACYPWRAVFDQGCTQHAPVPFIGRWQGATVVCIASGPSLTADDCETVQAWREAGTEKKVIVVNTSYRLAPWSDVLFAMDKAWWDMHIEEIRATFRGELQTSSTQCKRHGLQPLGTFGRGWQPYGNSGAGAISLCKLFGAKRVILLGYDCKKAGDKVHWHGNHPAGLGNAGSMHKWPAQFGELAKRLGGVEVVNCSRDTDLTAFPRGNLEQALAST